MLTGMSYAATLGHNEFSIQKVSMIIKKTGKHEKRKCVQYPESLASHWNYSHLQKYI